MVPWLERMMGKVTDERKRLVIIAIVATLAAYASFLYRSGKPFFNDWFYFNSLSLVVRSLILNYHVFPVHNPWECGGLDLLTNPQNRIFSPSLILDVIFPPQWSNLVGLMLYGLIGFLGSAALLFALGCSRAAALVGATLFINGSWFGLHFAEGHIPYGSMQLLPLVMYFALKMGDLRHLIYLAMSFCIFILDGGIYTTCFAAFLLLTMVISRQIPSASLQQTFALRRSSLWLLGVAGIFGVAPKLWPVVATSTLATRQPWIDFYAMPLPLIAKAFFFPFQTIYLATAEGSWYHFHEYGCYLGIGGVCLILWASLRHRSFVKHNLPFFLALLFWFWVGSGWLKPFNPWLLMHKIPLVNNVHVQSRVFLILYLFFIVLLAKALTAVRNKKVVLAISSLLVVESLVVRNYPMSVEPPQWEDLPGAALIQSTTLTTTIASGENAWHTSPQRYLRGNIGTARCYEPSFRPHAIRAATQPGYRGEVYLLDPQAGSVALRSYTPGAIEIAFQLTTPTSVELNTNALYGWQLSEGQASVAGFGRDLLRVTPDQLIGVVKLTYQPPYVVLALGSLVTSALLFVGLWRSTRKPS